MLVAPRPRRIAPILSIVLLLVSCAGLLGTADADASQETAGSLGLEKAHQDELNCSPSQEGDCVDWFRVAWPKRAQLRVDLKTLRPEGHTGAAPALAFSLLTQGGTALRKRGPGASLRTSRTLDPGTYWVRVDAGRATGKIAYELRARQLALAVKSWSVLSVEPATAKTESRLLIGGGSEAGLKVGFLGRVVSGGKPAGRVKVVEVYPEGALLELLGKLNGTLSADAQAEIEFPPGR